MVLKVRSGVLGEKIIKSEIKINDKYYKLVDTYIKQLDLSDIKFNTLTYRAYNAKQYVKK